MVANRFPALFHKREIFNFVSFPQFLVRISSAWSAFEGFHQVFNRVLSHLSPDQKSRLRTIYWGTRQAFVRRFLSYGKLELAEALRSLGVNPGDALMVHSSFSRTTGFTGSPNDCIDVLL